MYFQLQRIFSRRKIRSELLRFTIFSLSVFFVVFMISKGKNGLGEMSNDENPSLSRDYGFKFSDNYKSQITKLSAKDIKRFHELNPVIEGWGENGHPVTLESETENKIAKKQFSKGAFNVYISDRISPNRTLFDPRPPECSDLDYDFESLGTCSVVIIFTDEIWSALIRTIWSTWNRTPASLLKEIILVDDASTRSELQQELHTYCRHHFGDKIKIIRSDVRIGLIKARMKGARSAAGDVIVFLDSHCEVTTGWLEPLMSTIAEDTNSVVCPVIDVISDKTLEYSNGSPYFFQVGSFTWSGHFTWIDVPEKQIQNHPTRPVKSPTMAGGLFAINREYFFKIGAYDEAMEIWGGENLELSFRIWQCGGSLYIHPCSHVGHIFRDYHPYSFQGKDTHGINTLRTVMVWMEPEYRRYFFMHRQDLEHKDPGDLTSRLALKKKLNCKSFTWYLENVFTNKKYIYDRDAIGWGWVKNKKSNLCLDTLNMNEEQVLNLGLYHCANNDKLDYTNQFFTLTNDHELRREEVCATAVDISSDEVQLDRCIIIQNASPTLKVFINREKKRQIWHHIKGGALMNEATNKCLTTKNLKTMSNVRLAKCDPFDPHQKWSFQKMVSSTKLAK